MPRGPEGGVVGRPVIALQNPGTLYVAAAGTLFKTTDAASHWTEFGASPITILAVDPQNASTLYGANNNALFKSPDAGLTWNPSGTGLPCPCTNLSSFVIDPGNPSTLYAAFSGSSVDVNGGVFKSTDGGATWSNASVRPAGFPASALRVLLVRTPVFRRW